MLKPPPSPDKYDTLSDTSAYARPIDDFGDPSVTNDPIGNLKKIRQMMIDKRRYLAQDAITYPVMFIGRAQDIAEAQKLIDALEQAILHEQTMNDCKVS